MKSPLKPSTCSTVFSGIIPDWVCGTRIQAWAQDRNLAVVMLSGENKFYVDNPVSNEMYGTFIGKELVDFTRRSFPLSRNREDTYIGGLSMGGFGSIVNGLQNPETFGGGLRLSSALILDKAASMTEYTDFLMDNKGYYESVFGDLGQLGAAIRTMTRWQRSWLPPANPNPAFTWPAVRRTTSSPPTALFRDHLKALLRRHLGRGSRQARLDLLGHLYSACAGLAAPGQRRAGRQLRPCD